jgi:PIN domain nuclease of toxin-antitoxin system
MILLDTHIALWLYTGDRERIPQSVQALLSRETLSLSPFTVLELAYLHERGRVTDPPDVIAGDLRTRLGANVSDIGAAEVCRAALTVHWTRDPFDRLLAAHATVSGLTLVTKDETIRRHLPLAWWAE